MAMHVFHRRNSSASPAAPLSVMSRPVAASTIFRTTDRPACDGGQPARSSRIHPARSASASNAMERSRTAYHSTFWTSSVAHSCGSTVTVSDAGSAVTSGSVLPPPSRLSVTLTV